MRDGVVGEHRQPLIGGVRLQHVTSGSAGLGEPDDVLCAAPLMGAVAVRVGDDHEVGVVDVIVGCRDRRRTGSPRRRAAARLPRRRRCRRRCPTATTTRVAAAAPSALVVDRRRARPAGAAAPMTSACGKRGLVERLEHRHVRRRASPYGAARRGPAAGRRTSRASAPAVACGSGRRPCRC